MYESVGFKNYYIWYIYICVGLVKRNGNNVEKSFLTYLFPYEDLSS